LSWARAIFKERLPSGTVRVNITDERTSLLQVSSSNAARATVEQPTAILPPAV
jgi:hypothetical protein